MQFAFSPAVEPDVEEFEQTVAFLNELIPLHGNAD